MKYKGSQTSSFCDTDSREVVALGPDRAQKEELSNLSPEDAAAQRDRLLNLENQAMEKIARSAPGTADRVDVRSESISENSSKTYDAFFALNRWRDIAIASESQLWEKHERLAALRTELSTLTQAYEAQELELSSFKEKLKIKTIKNERLKNRLAQTENGLSTKALDDLKKVNADLDRKLNQALHQLRKVSGRLRDVRAAYRLASDEATNSKMTVSLVKAQVVDLESEIHRLNQALEVLREIRRSEAAAGDEFRESVSKMIVNLSAKSRWYLEPRPEENSDITGKARRAIDMHSSLDKDKHFLLEENKKIVDQLRYQLKIAELQTIEYARSLTETECELIKKNAQLKTILEGSIWKVGRSVQRLLQVLSRVALFRRQRALLKPHFDEEWYILQYPQAVLSSFDPLGHFIYNCLADNLDPNPLFSTRWYLIKNPDVAAANLLPILHFVKFGLIEGRDPHPSVDFELYQRRYPRRPE